MSNVINIHGNEITVKELDGQRVVTFDDIDKLHNRPSGTARKRANENQEHLIENEDYFNLTGEALSEFRTNLPDYEISKFTPKLTLITESGYLMIVKSLTDDLAWRVQRELVNNYFRKTVQKPQTLEDLIILQAQSVKELKNQVKNHQEQIESIKETIIHTDEDWRNWVNDLLNKTAFHRGNYRELRKQTYDILENRAHCRLKVRLRNLRSRLKEAGATQTRIAKTNYLDVIEDDIRLKEIYTSVVEKISIKFSA